MSDNFQVDDRPGVDDPIWTYVLKTRLEPFIPFVRDWWANAYDFSFLDTGIGEICGDQISGLYVRFTRTAIRSPIRGIQAFPFVPTARLQITGVQGGSTKMIDRVCLENRFKMDEFTIVCKSNLPSIFNASQIVAFIPTDMLENLSLGVWLYFTKEELSLLARGETNEAIKLKALLKA